MNEFLEHMVKWAAVWERYRFTEEQDLSHAHKLCAALMLDTGVVAIVVNYNWGTSSTVFRDGAYDGELKFGCNVGKILTGFC